jgi:hypothetical protein
LAIRTSCSIAAFDASELEDEIAALFHAIRT